MPAIFTPDRCRDQYSSVLEILMDRDFLLLRKVVDVLFADFDIHEVDHIVHEMSIVIEFVFLQIFKGLKLDGVEQMGLS